MKFEEHKIVQQVMRSRQDPEAADQLIRSYMPFIKAETARFIHRPPVEGRDDELSVAMFAFYETMTVYNPDRGPFLPLAAARIRNRLIDYFRKEQKHSGQLSLDQPAEEDGCTLLEKTDPGVDDISDYQDLAAAQSEIETFSAELAGFGLSLTDVADSCPRQERTLDACMKVLDYAKKHPELLEQMIRSRKLPLSQLALGSGAEKKTLERHRKYLIAILLAFTNGFEIIRGHLSQMKKGGAAE
ncbi:MAG: sigma factor [Clostridium sp.]